MNRKITCKNEDGMSITFGSSFSPYLLVDVEGIYSSKSNVTISQNTMTDGGTYQGAVASIRNIVLTIATKENHQKNRMQLNNLFKHKSPGTFIYEENGVKRQIEYYVEEVDPASKNNCRYTTVSLICPDPYYTELSDTVVVMAGWESLFEFPHEFSDEGEELETRVNEKLKTIENLDAADNIGLTITISSSGEVRNPSVYHVENNEFIKVGTENIPFDLNVGDLLIITTGLDNKHVYLERDGEKTEINGYLDENSEFIQLMHGKNTLGYSADIGEDYITVEVSFRYKFLGV